MDVKKEYGLLLRRDNRYGTDHLSMEVVRREEGRDGPLGCSSDGESSWEKDVPKHLIGLQLDGLTCDGHASRDYKSLGFIGFEPEYMNVYSATLPKLERMRKTLKKVLAAKDKDKAYEPGDLLASIANVLKLSFVVVKRDNPRDPDGRQWDYMSVAEGRNCLRRLIEDMVKANAA